VETCLESILFEYELTKALTVFEYSVKAGSENVVRWGKDNLYVVKSLREFQHIDDEGIDQGAASIVPSRHC